jgi:hypothetical protein
MGMRISGRKARLGLVTMAITRLPTNRSGARTRIRSNM